MHAFMHSHACTHTSNYVNCVPCWCAGAECRPRCCSSQASLLLRTCATLPPQASLLLFALRYPTPGLANLAFMSIQAFVFAVELTWRRRGLRLPDGGSYAGWRGLLVSMLRLNEGLLGSMCLVSEPEHATCSKPAPPQCHGLGGTCI